MSITTEPPVPTTDCPIIGPTNPASVMPLDVGWVEYDTLDDVQLIANANGGSVWLDRSQTTSRLFVLKLMTPYKLDTDLQKKHFSSDSNGFRIPDEVHMLKTHIKPHRNLVQCLDIWDGTYEQLGTHFIWQEWCAAGDVQAQMAYWIDEKEKMVPEVFVMHVICGVADGLAWLHQGLRHVRDGKYTQDENHKAIIHGDIKPENIFLRWHADNIGGMPDAVIGDFGSSKLESEERSVSPGTLRYGPPEDQHLIRGVEYSRENIEIWHDAMNKHTTAVDTYAFGQMLYFMTSGNEDVVQIGTDPKDLKVHAHYKHSVLEDVVRLCMMVDPVERGKFSFEQPTGLLSTVDKIRKLRDRIIREEGDLEQNEWKQPRLD